MAGRLYVFLHGLMLLAEKGPPGFELEIVVPHVHGHIYRAGSWLQETEIKPDAKSRRPPALRLKGVKSGTKGLYDQDEVKDGWVLNLLNVRKPASLKLKNHKPAFILTTPKPDRVLALLRVQAPNLITADDGSLISDKIATAHVLLYHFDDENGIALDGHYWEPFSIGGSISLHIIASPEGQTGADHQMHTNHTLKGILQPFPGIKIAWPPPAVPSWRFPMDPNYGLDPINPSQPDLDRLQPCRHPGLKDCFTNSESPPAFAFSFQELEDFPARSVRLDRLGRLEKLGRPLASLENEPDPLGPDVTACTLMAVKKR